MKFLKIAIFDFKRLVFNRFTGIGFCIVLALCLLLGLAFNPTTSYTLSLSYDNTYETASDILSAFETTEKDVDGEYFPDTKAYLDVALGNNQSLIISQQNSTTVSEWSNVLTQLEELYSTTGSLYILATNPTMISSSTYSECLSTLQGYVSTFTIFLEKVENTELFYDVLYFTESDIAVMNALEVSLVKIENATTSTLESVCQEVWEERTLYDAFKTISPTEFAVESDVLAEYLISYHANVAYKLELVRTEMQNATDYTSARNLILRYKELVVSANEALTLRLQLYVLENNKTLFKELFGSNYDKLAMTQELTIYEYNLESDNLYYTSYIQALSFNTATDEATAYDLAYYEICILSIFIIILAIYFTYRLFGQDRKDGKMDMVMAQGVSPSAVFAGKFLAIVFATTFLLVGASAILLLCSFFISGFSYTTILAVFNYTSAFLVSPFVYLLLKLIAIELEAIFYVVVTMFCMNLSRRFNLMLAISFAIFAIGFIGNIFLSGTLVYTFLPFVHANFFSYFGGGTASFGLLSTNIIASGSFYISLCYYFVFTIAFYNFTNLLFKQN